MELLEKVRETINKYSMLSEAEHVLIGLSGGADSVCLTILLSKLREDFNLTLSAVYIDHGLRPEETEHEKAFCKALCNNLGIDLHIKGVDVRGYAKENKLNLQEAGRELRYKVYEGLANGIKAERIALGHNADDQAETFLIRLLRGSGEKGLSGIPPVRRQELRTQKSEVRSLTIIRPLIEVERSEIEKFLSQNPSVSFMVNSSNLKKDYLRNWIRLRVMPELKRGNPALVRNICRTMDILREEDEYLELIVARTLRSLISRKDDALIELLLLPLKTMETAILRRLLRRAIDAVRGLKGINFTHIEDIIRLIRVGRSGDRIYLPERIRAVKGYSTLLLTSRPPSKLSPITFTVPGEVVLREAEITLKAEISEVAGARFAGATLRKDSLWDGKTSAVFDLDKLSLPLEVRSRKYGDYFYPSGFGKRKKLQDFLVDEKVPRDERGRIPIVLSGGDIIWITGYRADERFKVTEDTKRVLLLEIKALK